MHVVWHRRKLIGQHSTKHHIHGQLHQRNLLHGQKVSLLIHSAPVPILGEVIDPFEVSSIISHKGFSLKVQAHAMIWVAKKLTISAATEFTVIVVTSCNGSMIIEGIQTDRSTNIMLSTRGIYKVRGNAPFRILVTNSTKTPVMLRKNMLIAVARNDYRIQAGPLFKNRSKCTAIQTLKPTPISGHKR